ncbi:type II toxin-antitoxin system death-on-curing family toxin [Salmonella enterica]|nr:type II toxin-antitoxin system death-on-curing family toxin [Salmonella enterica]EBA9764662.1 type II toxin-antitoxin system death-on-curing family toxin [Salmonella enterica]ELF4900234.1 type II toxin-antitoxin system death-on-curing family toxin [Salmonella enterica]
MIIFLGADDIETIHHRVLTRSGPVNRQLLEGAVNRVNNLHYYKGVDCVFTLASMLMIAIVKAHAFNDGNKRTALRATASFLDLNGYEITRSPLLLTRLVVLVAKSADITPEMLAFTLKVLTDYEDEDLILYSDTYM